MKPKQLYLCGPITGIINYKKIFQDCAAELRNAGYRVVSPIEFCPSHWSWELCMRKCVQVLSQKKAIAVIEYHPTSKGMDLELTLGKSLGMEIKTVDEWIADAKKEAETRNALPFDYCPYCGAKRPEVQK